MRAKKGVQTDRDKLAKAMFALDQICQLASNQETEYPERIGAIRSVASRSLHTLGDSRWLLEFNKQLQLQLERGP